jgi:hypothetical protein
MSEKRKIQEPLKVRYEASGDEEPILVRRLSNTNLIRWVDLGFDKQFLVFKSIERPVAPGAAVNQEWFDTLTGESALEVVEKSLALNHSPALQKKILGPAAAMLQSFLSAMPSSISSPGATTSET